MSVNNTFYFIYNKNSTGLFEMIVEVLTTCHKQHTSYSRICIFYLIEQHCKFLLHTLQVLYMFYSIKKIHILLSQVYCVWQVVKTPTIISNNHVYCQGDMFRPLLGHLQAPWENRSKSYLYFNALWDPKCLQIIL